MVQTTSGCSTSYRNVLMLARLGYYKLAAAVQADTEQRPRNGLHHPHPKEISRNKTPTMDSDSLVLWRRPLTTLEYFFKELFILISTGLQSSVGLGTGLHTFLLYLGPHIARVTLAAYDIICPAQIDPNNAVSIWNIMSKVRIESMMWGIGTALGELPPYFMARAARLSGGGVAELAANDDSRTGRAKIMVQKLVQKVGFAGILACASVPNPLFDLAGLTCGHFLVPFWTFFGATVLGKAVIKMHIQKMFVIIAFNETLVGIPYIGPKLEAPLLEFLRNQKARLHKNDSAAPIENQGSVLSSLLDKFVLAMVVYFVVSIVNALAQNYSKRVGKKKGKKRE
ncbi:hypothetical protein SFRURICE_001346 [Spodoptera frugiperda]|nr:hypothetical protein SFRURICE_001346 [Spodoptera frugiperda]